MPTLIDMDLAGQLASPRWLTLCAALQAWLRELAWTQEDVAGLRATMAAKLPALKERLKQEPIFCFDVAAKLLLWSDLVYTYEQKEAEGEEP